MMFFSRVNTAVHVTVWPRSCGHELPRNKARKIDFVSLRFAIAACLACKQALPPAKSTCIDILRFLVYIHGSIHIIHIVIHRKSRLIARFLMVFHTFRAEYVTLTVERICKNRPCRTHSICNYGVTVSSRFCSFHMQNHAVTSKFAAYFTKTTMFFYKLFPTRTQPEPARNPFADVAMLRERRLMNRLLKKYAVSRVSKSISLVRPPRLLFHAVLN